MKKNYTMEALTKQSKGDHDGVKGNFGAKKITRVKERHYILVEESIHQEGITILNIEAPENRGSKYKKQKLSEQKRSKYTHNYTCKLQHSSLCNIQK